MSSSTTSVVKTTDNANVNHVDVNNEDDDKNKNKNDDDDGGGEKKKIFEHALTTQLSFSERVERYTSAMTSSVAVLRCGSSNGTAKLEALREMRSTVTSAKREATHGDEIRESVCDTLREVGGLELLVQKMSSTETATTETTETTATTATTAKASEQRNTVGDISFGSLYISDASSRRYY